MPARLRNSARRPVAVFAAIASLLAFGPTRPHVHAAGPAQAEDADERAERLAALRDAARRIDFRLGEGDAPRVDLSDEPLFRFNDNARGVRDGAIWAWGPAGRPVALVAIEQYNGFRAYELISLTGETFEAVVGEDWTWSPSQPGIRWAVYPEAPPVADNEAGRLRQMKELARRFRLVTVGADAQKIELRPLAREVRRYADPDAGATDGAVFVYAYGTNPEAVVLLEAQGSSEQAARWHYAVAPLTTAAVEAQLGDREVWAKPASRLPKTQDPYTYFTDEDPSGTR